MAKQYWQKINTLSFLDVEFTDIKLQIMNVTGASPMLLLSMMKIR